MRSPRLIVLPVLLTLLMTGCETTPKIGTVSTVDGVPTPAPASTGVSPPHYILCSLDPIISYAGSENAEGKKLAEDATNRLDTDATVGDTKTRGTIRYHNAVVKAACGG